MFLFHAFLSLSKTRKAILILGLANILAVISTVIILTGGDNLLAPDVPMALSIILIDLVLLLALSFVIVRRVVALFIQRKHGSVGSRLQMRIVVMFVLVASVPTLIMAVFSAFFFNMGIQAWFDAKVSTAIDESVAVARGYMEEHQKIIRADILGMANDLNRDAYNIRRSPQQLNQKIDLITAIRKLPEAIVFRQTGKQLFVIGSSQFSYAMQMFLDDLPPAIIERAEKGELVILNNEPEDRVIALIKLENFFNTYLLVGRYLDTNIIEHIQQTMNASSHYRLLQNNLSTLQIMFFVIFAIISFLLLMTAVWFGLIFSGRLVGPIKSLVTATERVKEGDWRTRVEEGPEHDEIATLARAFNRMITQLQVQQTELISAQRRSAWSDVARRIAHEIKNPLTPVQLACERLKRKFSVQINEEERPTFDRYLETISRNILQIASMVEEFVSFARLPSPQFSTHDLKSLLESVVADRQDIHPHIHIDLILPKGPCPFYCDQDQISRVMSNIIKNAEEAIIQNTEKKKPKKAMSKGEKANHEGPSIITVALEAAKGKFSYILTISDMGGGFAEGVIPRVTEPYVTTKEKGTGLGLAIVKKIVEDHNGEIEIYNIDEGASVKVSFKS